VLRRAQLEMIKFLILFYTFFLSADRAVLRRAKLKMIKFLILFYTFFFLSADRAVLRRAQLLPPGLQVLRLPKVWRGLHASARRLVCLMCVCVCVRACTHAHACVCVPPHMCVCVHTQMFVYTLTQTHIILCIIQGELAGHRRGQPGQDQGPAGQG
jgi:hypothetical protein